ncbi:DinB family protein [Granulicella sp. dw_53]|uniref:DinB family protein n=1 Tax=Granulicella sp. dw_53 TaxID=2719792 RepID=UPI001BD51E94|nr:DinB family protein [Granulicella sp. dw_53]
MTTSTEARLLKVFNLETGFTRKILAVIPQDKLDWRPHEKSMTLGVLVEHTSKLLILARYILQTTELDVFKTPPPHMNLEGKGVEDIMEEFDALTTECQTLIQSMSEEELEAQWTLSVGERICLQTPRSDAIQIAVLLHLSHHRGQITVYLRLLNIPVPPIYGPTAEASWEDFLSGLPPA